MNVIYKYELLLDNNYRVKPLSMPSDAKILHVGTQDNKMFLWAEIDDESSNVNFDFDIFGTGHENILVLFIYIIMKLYSIFIIGVELVGCNSDGDK